MCCRAVHSVFSLETISLWEAQVNNNNNNNNNSIFTCPVQLCGCVHVKVLKGWNKKVDVGLYTVCTGMYAHSLVDATYREVV